MIGCYSLLYFGHNYCIFHYFIKSTNVEVDQVTDNMSKEDLWIWLYNQLKGSSTLHSFNTAWLFFFCVFFCFQHHIFMLWTWKPSSQWYYLVNVIRTSCLKLFMQDLKAWYSFVLQRLVSHIQLLQFQWLAGRYPSIFSHTESTDTLIQSPWNVKSQG